MRVLSIRMLFVYFVDFVVKPMSLSPRIRNHLEYLYGAARVDGIARELEALIQRVRAGLPLEGHPSRRTLTHRHVYLIAYADQIREPGISPLRALREFADRHLPELISDLHLLPFFPWSSDDGFAVKNYLSVDPAHGTWEDIGRIGQHFGLMFDLVLNHLSSQSDWFEKFLAQEPPFDAFFLTVEGESDLSQVVRPRALPLLTEFKTANGPRRVWTTFGPDQVDLDFRNPTVLLSVLEALLVYAARGATTIRLDAVAFLWKEVGTACLHLPQTHRVIQLMRALLDEVAPDVLLITETNVPHCDNLSYFGDGTDEAQLVYNFALPPLVLHAVQLGDATALTTWAASLSLPSPKVTFFNFLASHDGIGLNPVRDLLPEGDIQALVDRALAHGGFVSYKNMPNGSRMPYELNLNYLDALSNPAGDDPADTATRKQVMAHAIMLSIQGVPALYFHSLFGSRGDRAGAEASGIPRRINRAKLERARLQTELENPTSLRAKIFGAMSDLLRIRRAQEAFAPSSPQRILMLHRRVFAVLRGAGGTRQVLGLHNVASEAVTVEWPTEVSLSKEGALAPWMPAADLQKKTVTLPPYAVTWLSIP